LGANFKLVFLILKHHLPSNLPKNILENWTYVSDVALDFVLAMPESAPI
jgi:hypothetical protein